MRITEVEYTVRKRRGFNIISRFSKKKLIAASVPVWSSTVLDKFDPCNNCATQNLLTF